MKLVKNVLAITTLLAVAPATYAQGNSLEVGPVQIISYDCRTNASKTTCTIETNGDLGGAEYKLTIYGDDHTISPIVSLLPILESRGSYVYLSAQNLQEVHGDVYTGTFESIIIKPFND